MPRLKTTWLALPALIAALLTLLATLWPLPAPAQWTNDPYHGMVTVCNDPAYQDYSRVRALGDGNSLFAWDDMRTGIDQVYYQMLNGAGVPLLETNGCPLFDGDWIYGWGSSSKDINLIPDGQGGAVIVVIDLRDSTVDIYGQRLDASGNRLWGPTGLPLAIWPHNEDIFLGDVAYDCLSGIIFIAYRTNGDQVSSNLIQKINLSGELLWGDYGILVSGGLSYVGDQQMVPDGQGGVLIVWADYRWGGIWPYFYFQHLDSLGNALLPFNGRPVMNFQGFQMGGYLGEGVPDGSGGGIWVRRHPTGTGTNYLQLCRLSSTGQTLWDWQSPYDCHHWIGDVKRHPSYGTTWVTSSEDRQGGENYEYYLYCSDVNGRALFGQGGIRGMGERLAPTSDGMISIGTKWDQATHVTAHRLDTSGRQIWQSQVALGRNPPGGGYLLGASCCWPDGQDGAFVALDDRRMAPADYFNVAAQRVLSDGSLGNPQLPPVQQHAGELISGISITEDLITYTLPTPGMVKFELFDLMGRRLSSTEREHTQAGVYLAPLSDNSLSSGVYLLRLTTPIQSQTTKFVITR